MKLSTVTTGLVSGLALASRGLAAPLSQPGAVALPAAELHTAVASLAKDHPEISVNVDSKGVVTVAGPGQEPQSLGQVKGEKFVPSEIFHAAAELTSGSSFELEKRGAASVSAGAAAVAASSSGGSPDGKTIGIVVGGTVAGIAALGALICSPCIYRSLRRRFSSESN
jgi:hypothetical protein